MTNENPYLKEMITEKLRIRKHWCWEASI